MTVTWDWLLYGLAGWGAFDLTLRAIFRVPLMAGWLGR